MSVLTRTELEKLSVMYEGDKNRDATSKIRGFLFQDYVAIMSLLKNQVKYICLEYLEDDTFEIIQVKYYPKTSPKMKEISTDLYYQYLRLQMLQSTLNDFSIEMTKTLEREVSIMCNLSKGVEEKGIEKGILLSIRNLMETMGWSVEQAMEGLKIPEEEKTKYLDELHNKYYGVVTMNNNRPTFNEIKSYDEFVKYYWYRDELSKICKQLGIDNTGTKQELNQNIKEYFNGNLIKKKKSRSRTNLIAEVTLNSPLLDCGFSFNTKFREFFSQQTGVDNFKFTADMATAWRKVKKENDTSFTIQDMLNVYYCKSDYAKYDNSTCEWNKFLKDFCADERNTQFKNKLKVASILWKIVRDSDLPKVYTYDLVIKYLKTV